MRWRDGDVLAIVELKQPELHDAAVHALAHARVGDAEKVPHDALALLLAVVERPVRWRKRAHGRRWRILARGCRQRR